MPKPPPTTEQILDLLRRVTPASYHDPFFDDPGGAIAQFRGFARANAEVAKVAGRSASRQMFLTPPGFEPAGFGSRARATLTIRRSQDLDTTLIAKAGALSLVGPNARLYRTDAEVIWYAAPDPEDEREVTILCDLIGEPGNLEWYADAAGNLHDADDQPRLDVLDLEELSQGRAGTKATLVKTPGTLAQLVDDGSAPTFAPSDVGLHLRINLAATAGNIGRLLRIVGWSISETPGPNGIYPRTITLDDGPQPYLATAAIQDDGGVLTDYTGAAQAGTPNAVQLLPATPAIGDAFYIGADQPFGTVQLEISGRRYGELTLAWEWWDGALWQPVADLVDGSEALTVEQLVEVSHTPDPGWALTTISGRTAYYLRARVTAFVSQSQAPATGRIVTLIAAELAPDPLDSNGEGQIGWSIQDWRDLGLVITSMQAPAGGRDDDLGHKLLERGLRRRPGESEDALRRRASRFPDVVTPEMITWEINRLLEPLGLAGKVCDLHDGVTGLFWDAPVSCAPDVVGAWDLYGPGDMFPANPTLLPLSLAETRWHFFVCVPPSGLGEFGAAWDQGPPAIFSDVFGTFLGSAWDFAFADGYPTIAASAYRDVWQRVQEAKAGGIRFTMVQRALPTCP